MDKEYLINLLNATDHELVELINLISSLDSKKDITYSKNIFIPITEVCKNDCGYCSFKKDPEDK
ncbi:7,8-didemethyl-8-hydroxy-5-deazariboflavin synthase subunit CofG, partial [Methanobrevibacter sp. OttesenSCG-928-I08]|nr:7,8-didemethyl-8-hydroxy-5-deazariboflavin synthase subunit CofG [Methanobrevibacter sp. OttesenSCG-928-I08]